MEAFNRIIVCNRFNLIFRENHLPKGLKHILNAYMMSTSADLNAKENISVIHFMEKEVLELARRNKFGGILTTNISPLTQQLGSNIFGYKTMVEYQINQYIHCDGTRPFIEVPDTKTMTVDWKAISSE